MPPRTHTVEIDCSNGNFEYHENSRVVIVNHGDKIKWICKDPNHYYAVHLGWHSPLPKCRYRNGPGGTIEEWIPPNSPPGEYKYTVAVFDGKNIWMDDPIFIIRD